MYFETHPNTSEGHREKAKSRFVSLSAAKEILERRVLESSHKHNGVTIERGNWTAIIEKSRRTRRVISYFRETSYYRGGGGMNEH